LKSPADEAQMRDDSGTDQPARLDGDLQSTMPPQAEADVVGKVLIAVARLEHAVGLARTEREQPQMKSPSSGGPDLPAIACH
jgi:hypothetical protein